MTVLIGMFLLGLFIALGTWVLSWSDHVKKGLQVKVYFAAGTTDRAGGVRRHADPQGHPARQARRLHLEGDGAEADEGEVPGSLQDAVAVEPAARRVGRHAGARAR